MIKVGQTIVAADFVIQVTAGVALSAREAVYILASDGKAYKGDASDVTKIGFVGFAEDTYSLGATANIRTSGIMGGFSGLTVGAPYYLDATTPGAITSTKPTNFKIVGIAVSTTTIKIADFNTVNTKVFTSGGTWTKKGGLKYIIVEVQGGGGAGGGSTSSREGASGGGAGGYSKKTILASELSSTETVTVGAGGAGVSAANGNNGAASSFGSFCTSNGGSGGIKGSGSSGGAGGTATSGDVNITGGNGHESLVGFFSSTGATNGIGGKGGDSILGKGGPGLVSGAGTNGNDGLLYGGGGGGSDNNGSGANTGGNGAAGIVIVTEYY